VYFVHKFVSQAEAFHKQMLARARCNTFHISHLRDVFLFSRN